VVFEAVAEELHGRVFEGGGGAVGEATKVDAVFEGGDGDDVGFGEFGGGVGAGADIFEVVGGYVVDEEGEHVSGEGCIALLVKEVAPAVELSVPNGGVLLGQVESTIWGESFEEDIAETAGGVFLVSSR